LSGEREGARLPIHSKAGDGVASLIAGVQETARGIDRETARIVAARPFLTGECPHLVWGDCVQATGESITVSRHAIKHAVMDHLTDSVALCGLNRIMMLQRVGTLNRT
jgi:hypothetical protein